MGGEGGAPQGQRGAFSELPHGIHLMIVLSNNSLTARPSAVTSRNSYQDWTFTQFSHHLFCVHTGSGTEPPRLCLSDANTWADVIGCPLTNNNNSRPLIVPPEVPGPVPYTCVPSSWHPTPTQEVGIIPVTDEGTETQRISMRRLVTY